MRAEKVFLSMAKKHLRHTGATLMVGFGIDLKTVQEICGHENIKTTMNYTHLLAERIRDAARNFAIVPQAASKVA